MSAIRLLRDLSESVADAYEGDCLKYAHRLIEALRAEGRDAWLGRLRRTEQRGDSVFHFPLVALRYRNRGLARVPAWTTHYVACCAGEAWDPLSGRPIAIVEYPRVVFGEELEVERVEES